LLIEPGYGLISIRRQCELVGLARNSFYYQPAMESPLNLLLMRLLDEQYTRSPFYGRPRMTERLRRLGYAVNPKRIQRLMRIMGLQAVYPKPRTTVPAKDHRVYPYLLRGLRVVAPNQAWCADITYVPMVQGFMYLVAVMDWFSRYVLSWELSNTLDGAFCLEVLRSALHQGQPQIFNTDQGSQFTAQAFADTLETAGIRISMNGRGRALDNVFVERLWRSVKYEDIYLKQYDSVPSLLAGLEAYFTFYNDERPHQSLGYRTPAEIHCQSQPNTNQKGEQKVETID
jgi:putative transposase